MASATASVAGMIWRTFSVSGAIYMYAFRHAPPIVRLVDASPKIRSYG